MPRRLCIEANTLAQNMVVGKFTSQGCVRREQPPAAQLAAGLDKPTEARSSLPCSWMPAPTSSLHGPRFAACILPDACSTAKLLARYTTWVSTEAATAELTAGHHSATCLAVQLLAQQGALIIRQAQTTHWGHSGDAEAPCTCTECPNALFVLA